MKVLLYETGFSGHRPLYRDYYKRALEINNVEVFLYTETIKENFFGFNDSLQKLAQKNQCALIHLLTMDDHTKKLFFSFSAKNPQIKVPVIGTYYQYQNFANPIKAFCLNTLFSLGKINGFIVPVSMRLLEPNLFSFYLPNIFALADPVEKRLSTKLKKEAAIKYLCLPEDWINYKVVLVFGVLNKRRGVNEIATFLNKNNTWSLKYRFLFAGRLDSDSLTGKTLLLLKTFNFFKHLAIIDKWLTQEEVETVFDCSDIFLINPEPHFQGHNSTVSLAVHFGLPVIAPSDCISGKTAAAKNRAVLFKRGNLDSFSSALNKADSFGYSHPCEGIAPHEKDQLTLDLPSFGDQLKTFYKHFI